MPKAAKKTSAKDKAKVTDVLDTVDAADEVAEDIAVISVDPHDDAHTTEAPIDPEECL